jgi:type IV secretion system protein TrbL
MPSNTVVLADDCGVVDVSCKIGGAIGDWFSDLALKVAKGATDLMAQAMTWWTQSDRSSMLQSPAIDDVRGMLFYVAVILLTGSVMWQGIVMIIKRKPDPLVSVGMGLLSFVGWTALGTTIAVMINEAGIALSSQILSASIDKFSRTLATAMQAQVGDAVAVVLFLALIMFFLAAIQWILGFFRFGALVILLALLPTAAAGQINESTKPWLRKLLSWCLTLLLYQPIGAVIYSIGFLLIGDGQDIGTILTGMAVLAMAVIAMPTMLRFFQWGGQQLVSGGGGGGAAAMGAAASMVGGGGASGFSKFMDSTGPGGGKDDGESSGAQSVTPANQGEADGPANSPTASPTGKAGGAQANAGQAEVSAAGTTEAAGTGAGVEAAGPAGAAVAGAEVAKDVGDKAAGAVEGAMTDGAGGGNDG